jgi:uncharacterized protein (TIGR03382 family)
VALSNPSYQTVTVDWAVNDGTAQDETGDGDYLDASGTVTFAPGVVSQPVTVQVSGDPRYEGDETFTVDLSNPANATILDAQGLGTVQDDDFPSISIGDVALDEGDASLTDFVFTVTLSKPSIQTVTVDWAVNDDTAEDEIGDGDYLDVSGTETFPPGVVSQTVTVQVAGDVKFESDETFTVDLSSPVNATILDAQGLGTIQDDDGQPTMSIDDVALGEGDSLLTDFVFSVTLTNPSDQIITVDWGVSDGTAEDEDGNADYVDALGTVTFAPDVVSQTITVQVVADTKYEGDETFTVDLSDPTNATITDAQGLGTIQNDDVQPTVSIDNVALVERDIGTTDFTFSVALSNASSQVVTVDYATADGDASAGADYAAAAGTVIFIPGETRQPISVQVAGDTTPEGDETFMVDLTAASNATIVGAQGVGTIKNDDGVAPQVTYMLVDGGGDEGGCSATGGGAGSLAVLLPLGVLVFLRRRRRTVRV